MWCDLRIHLAANTVCWWPESNFLYGYTRKAAELDVAIMFLQLLSPKGTVLRPDQPFDQVLL